MNRPDYFKMARMGGEFTWEWHANKQSLNVLTPFKLTYSKLMNTSEEFDSAMIANPAIGLSFMDVFIPEMRYTYTYDNKIGAISQMLYDTMTGIQWGKIKDEFGWIVKI